MSEFVDSLLKHGFTLEDLYNKGILVEANREQEQQEQQEQYITKADLDSFKQELLQVVQSVNRSGAVRESQPAKKMTMAEAIIGLTKEVK